MSPLISVIVPIYNVEKYLNRCVDSLINQTYNRLEIILVDDGSPDNCPAICDNYEKKDSRIRVIHKKNGGLSDARNAGMRVAAGEYIGFIDSDDYVSADFFETLLNTMLKENSDIVECSVVKFYEDNKFDNYKDDMAVKTCSAVESLSELISEGHFHRHVWNKLYKTRLVHDVPYAVGKLNEDEFWTYRIFGKAEKVTRINKTMYYYFQRKGSIMGESYSLRRLDALEGKLNRQKYIDKSYPELSCLAKVDLYGSCMFAYQSALKYMSGKDKKAACKKIRAYKKQCNISLSDIKTINNSSKKYFYFAKLSFYLCCKLRAVTGIGF